MNRHTLPMARMVAVTLAALVLIVVIGSQAAAQRQPPDQGAALAKIDDQVLAALAAGDETDFFVVLAERADLSPANVLTTKVAKGRFVFAALRETADRTQAGVLGALGAAGIQHRPFYIANKIYVAAGDLDLALALAGRPEVDRLAPNRSFQLQEPVDRRAAPEATDVIEPNLTFVNVDDVWALGYTGVGAVLAGNDTGLDWDHPAILAHYRGWDGVIVNHNYNWWDATGTYPMVPGDGHGHGTHTTGTMVGDDGGANRIGMAPGAKTVHCKNMTNGGSGSDLTFTTCFEWDLAPWDLSGANPDPDMAPDAITNSWGYWGGNDPVFEDEIAALQAAGIAVEVSAGNEGPGCASLRSPGDYRQVLTTGSVQHAGGVLPGTITSFSSRGPSDLYPNHFFPDIMAPGENIRSSVPGSSYEAWSGTSMSGPHATALIGLMWSASPALRGDLATTYDAISDTAVRLTGQTGSNCGGDYVDGPNNDWGYGTIDALAAVEEAIVRGGPTFLMTATPETLAICAPANGNYQVELLQIQGYDYDVTLSAEGHPVGTSATFAPPVLVPPGISLLTIGDTANGAAGSYELTITGTGSDPETKTDSATVGLDLFTAVPGSVTLLAPPDGATEVPPVPTLTWSAVAQGSAYEVAIATDPAFTNVVYAATTAATSHVVGTPLAQLTTYYWRVRAINACGTGAWGTPFSFTTADVPSILLVDDDDNSPDVQPAYVTLLSGLGLAYDLWNTNNSDNEPDAATLLQYEFVIWFTGDEFGGAAGPGAQGEAALGVYLDAGNCLLLSSQDYIYDRGLTPFMANYLGVGDYNNDVTQTTVDGRGVYAGLGPYALAYPFTNYSDRLAPVPGAARAFAGDRGGAAVSVDTGYRATFWGFPLEALPAPAQQATLQRTIDWCGTGPQPALELDYAYAMNDGDSGTGHYIPWEDGSFDDESGNGGLWTLRVTPALLLMRYTDGSHCGALSLGFPFGDNYRGFRYCLDGSGVRGRWLGTVTGVSDR